MPMLKVNHVDIHDAPSDQASINTVVQESSASQERVSKSNSKGDINKIPPRHVKLSLTDLAKVKVEEVGRHSLGLSCIIMSGGQYSQH